MGAWLKSRALDVSAMLCANDTAAVARFIALRSRSLLISSLDFPSDYTYIFAQNSICNAIHSRIDL